MNDGTASRRILADFFGIPDETIQLDVAGELSREPGFFTFGGITCFGRCSGAVPAKRANGKLPEVFATRGRDNDGPRLPFDLAEVVTNLREERYARHTHHWLERVTGTQAVKRAYYIIRPLMRVAVRKHLQKIRFHNWSQIPFPKWPVDTAVDDLMQASLGASLGRETATSVPFIWFWPDGAPSCAMMTHDVEGKEGRDFCEQLMTINESFGIPAAFQIVPEPTGEHVADCISRLRRRGFEVNVHDLRHDGSLFADREEFLRKAEMINKYARLFGSRGFRSGAMYRQQSWFDALSFSYDMSVPCVAHLEPQRGGCCTTFPYFVGALLELPLTTTQDYSLFHILGEYSTDLWKQQIGLITARHGLISFIAHPDYLREARALSVYKELLAHLAQLRAGGDLWIAAPGDIDTWWRSRAAMALVADGNGWRIEGAGSERARVAYAVLENNRLVYRVSPAAGRSAGPAGSGDRTC